MRVLITGGTGFVGSHVARLAAADGHEVTLILRPSTERWRLWDIERRATVAVCDPSIPGSLAAALESSRPELCVHLAWEGSPGGGPSASGNVGALAFSLELVRSLARTGCGRLVAAGSCFEYEEGSQPHLEHDPVSARDLYTLCKSAAHQIMAELCHLEGMTMAWPRIFYTYGPYENRHRLVPSVIIALLEGRPIATTAGGQVRDYLHVEDVAGAIWAIALGPVTGPVNVASGTAVTVREVVGELGRSLGRPDLLRIGELAYRANEPMTIRADVQMLRERVGWTPKYDLRSGLAQTIAWWRAALSGRPASAPIARTR